MSYSSEYLRELGFSRFERFKMGSLDVIVTATRVAPAFHHPGSLAEMPSETAIRHREAQLQALYDAGIGPDFIYPVVEQSRPPES